MKKHCIFIVFMLLFTVFNLGFNVSSISLHEAADGITTGYIQNDTYPDTYSYYFDTYTNVSEWDSPNYIVDGTLDYFATSYNDDPAYITLDNNTYDGNGSGSITSVELWLYGGDFDIGYGSYITVQPIIETVYGDVYTFDTETGHESYQWFDTDITNDTQAPDSWNWTNINNLDILVKGYSSETFTDMISCHKVEVRVTVEETFNLTRTIGSGTESNNFGFTPTLNYTDNVTFKIPVSTDVRGITDVTNNTDDIEAVEVNSTDELVNNSFYYDSANQFVYIQTVNLTVLDFVNWTVNCSYAATFNIHIPRYKEVGDDIFISGTIENSTGSLIEGLIARTHVYYSNGTDAISPVHKWNCTDGNYLCVLSTSTLPPGQYDISIDFTDTELGITFKYGSTLYLSISPEAGVYSDAVVHVNWYNTNFGLGLPEETLKLYINSERKYSTDYYTYIGAQINLTVKDYYGFTLYTNVFTINRSDYPIDLGLTFHEYDFSNSNDEYYVGGFLKSGASRWYELIIPARGDEEFLMPTGDYTIRVYNADNSSYTQWTDTVNNSKGYLIQGDNITQTIEGLSVVSGQILELSNDLYEATMPDIVTVVCNPPTVYSIYDKKGAVIGTKLVCPALFVTATTTNESTINSSTIFYPLIPDSDDDNGTITVKEDIMYFEGNTSAVNWVNVTYDTTNTNYSYIPNNIDLFGENVTIDCNTNITIKRVTTYQQLKKFYWTKYTEDNRYQTTISVINPLDAIIKQVYVIVEFANDTTPDYVTTSVYDVTNGVYLTQGENYFTTASGVHFYLNSMTAGSTRRFTFEYYGTSSAVVSSDAVTSVDEYLLKAYDNENYYYFRAQWVNTDDDSFIGSLSIDFNFDTDPFEISRKSLIVYDIEQNRFLDRDDGEFSYQDGSLTVTQSVMGTVSPNGARTFDVYFQFIDEDKVDDIVEIGGNWFIGLLKTKVFGLEIFWIVFVIGLVFALSIIYVAYDKHKTFSISKKQMLKDVWFAIGILIVLFFMFFWYRTF